MKKVLIIDSHPLFREFLKQKLYDDQIEVVLSQVGRDAYTRTISILPNLIILDMSEDRLDEMEFLEKKAADINTSRIPIIVIGPDIDKTNIAALAKYGVIKYFAKPIQFDIFFEAIGKILNNQLSLDTTPCVLDLHRNGNIIFIEIAQGLNREKIALLQYKLSELIEREEIDSPKIVIMLTNLELTFVDGYNLEFLIENVIACPKIHNKNVKILSLSSFVQAFLDGHPAYSGIEMSNNLPKVLNSLVDTTITSSVSDLITEKIITPSNMAEEDFGIAMVEAQAAGLPCLISDKVPIECKKTDLVFQYHLSDGAEKWADYVEKVSTIKKRDTSKEIKTAGFDICENAKWLEKFYCTKYDEIAGRKF